MKNSYEIRGPFTAIFLNRKDGTVLETLISTSDLEKAKEFKNTWCLVWKKNTNSFYVYGYYRTSKKTKTVTLHRFLFNNPENLIIDHINHDTLNNTRANLRKVNNSINQQNRKGAQKNSKSGVRGIYWDSRIQKWYAQITVSGKRKTIGQFANLKDAEKAVIEARKKYIDSEVTI